jgi:23S rRNA pseudouridine1911/1915/1917 synthase
LAITVEESDADERADVVLGRRVPGLSRRIARKLALEGRLRIDGTRARPSDRVRAGQVLQLKLPPGSAEAPSLRVIAQTEDFVYVDKAPGVHVVALVPGAEDALATAVARAFPECADASEDLREGGAIHRLDHDTSGVIAFARSRRAWEAGRRAFERGEVLKRYVVVCAIEADAWPPPEPEGALPGWLTETAALADPVPIADLDHGALPALRIRAPLGRGEQRESMAVRLDGQNSATVLMPRGRVPAGLACEVALETGRRHQIRVHAAWLGAPVVGDRLYGPPGLDGAPRLRLHAARLDLSVSLPRERPVTAPPAPDFLHD